MSQHRNPGHTGHKHSPEAIAKMRASKTGKKLGPQSAEQKAKISAANKGRVIDRVHKKTCACGSTFMAANKSAVFCSARCKRVSQGRSLKHADGFKHFISQCAICRSAEDLVGDHDHATGTPRGILCRKCNLAIGNMLDDPRRLRLAADYLERSRKKGPTAVYLSGPMSNMPDLNFPAFHKAAASLRASGYEVVNPAEMDEADATPMAWEDYLRRDIRVLLDCEGIALLPGWENSRGAKLEATVALALGLRPIYLTSEATPA